MGLPFLPSREAFGQAPAFQATPTGPAAPIVPGERQRWSSGPWRGVRDVPDPYGVSEDVLRDATNMYLPDPASGCGAYARAGFALVSATPFAGAGQCVFTHMTDGGLSTNWVVAGGRLYRDDGNLGPWTDVTPAGITIDAVTARVYMTSFVGRIVVSDGVNRPWLMGTDILATPVTGTPIDFTGTGTPWAAYGQPVEYGGALVCILKQVNNLGTQADIAWSLPGDALTGWQQPNYDYRWTLTQTGPGQLYALAATNLALYYFRDYSIGALTGTPNVNFQSDATHDAIAADVGCTQSATIQQFGRRIFFADALGRPWYIPWGLQPVPIWLNARAACDEGNANLPRGYSPTTSETYACSAVEAVHGLYVVAPFQDVRGGVNVSERPTWALVFDAKTGVYQGRWAIAAAGTAPVGHGTTLEAMGTVIDTDGSPTLLAIGSNTVTMSPTPTGGYARVQRNAAPLWMDDTTQPTYAIETGPLGYAPDLVLNVDQVSVVTGSAAPVTVSIETAAENPAPSATTTPSPALDGSFRAVTGQDAVGRGAAVTVTATDTSGSAAQWTVQRVDVTGVPSTAGPEDA